MTGVWWGPVISLWQEHKQEQMRKSVALVEDLKVRKRQALARLRTQLRATAKVRMEERN